MGKLLSLVMALALAAWGAAPAWAEDRPDAGVKGLWIKATNLPAEAGLEDFTQEDDEPYFIYSFGNGDDGPDVTIPVGRQAQSEMAERLAKLDKEALKENIGNETFFESIKDLTFVQSPELSEKFTYPCQLASYLDSDMGFYSTYLFIQTDAYLFTVNVNRSIKAKKYSDTDVMSWLMNMELVEQ